MILLLQFARNGVWPWIARWLPRRSAAAGPRRAAVAGARTTGTPRSDRCSKCKRARKQFGGLVAVNDLTFDIRDGEILGLIGPNGAGKSTTFALISGALPLTAGEIVFRGESIGSREPYRDRAPRHRTHVPARASCCRR